MEKRPEILNIAVLCEHRAAFDFAIRHILPSLEKYHGVEFVRNHADDSYQAPGFKVTCALKLEDVAGFKNYQLMKYGDFHNNPAYEVIAAHWARDVSERKNEQG